jgi:ribosomal protein S18 acetylase RimI-like enzyme
MFIKIDTSNINLLYDFINLNISPFFRYYNKREPLLIIKNHIYTVLLSDTSKNIVGYGHIDYENVNWIGLCVLDEYRGLGYGKSILAHLINHAISLNIEKLYLTVDNDNMIAINLYKKYGFLDDHIYDDYRKMIKYL